ncbi:hypothetical protein PMAYCL1PPCAC_23394 [Pristionchus mayeri]|uniref:Uncharacterized protein n=1 Tax=Pristionchus mayeri TaxID=1317129 RepID=A0AAN5D057_9BILA|nr:hypothetical protein PMAYCL1PPCAC_23394 [Pristionchus mayeri]
MLMSMVEQSRGQTPLDEIDVELAILQVREQIVLWMSKATGLASFLTVSVRALRDQDSSIERATLLAVKKALPSANWRFCFIVPPVERKKTGDGSHSSHSSSSFSGSERERNNGRPLVCLTLPKEIKLDEIAPRCVPFTLKKIVDDWSNEDLWKVQYSKSTMIGAVHFIKWLKEREKSDMKRLLTSSQRIITSCSHNPGLPSQHCIRLKAGAREITAEQRAITENAAKKLDKLCSSPMIFYNPLFNTDYAYAGRSTAGDLRFSRDGISLVGGGVSYEMHAASKANDAQRIEQLFTSGYDLNLRDDTGFTPIHYAAFMGNMKALGALMHLGCDVNISNKMGSTALHLAIMGVQPFVVELLLLHPKINRTAVDSNGCTPFDLGGRRKRNAVGEELGKLLYLLEFLEESPKILVTFPDRTSAMMKMESRKDTKADALLYQVLTQDTAMKATPEKAKELMNYFSIWVFCGDKGVQMEGNELAARVATAWEQINGGNGSIEIRRNQLMAVEEEKKISPNRTSQAMLVCEIAQYFQEGWLHTSREDAISMTVSLPPRMNHSLEDTFDRLPKKMKNAARRSAEERQRLMREIEKETALLDRNLSYSEREGRFLAKARKSPTYGCRPYECIVDYIMPRSDSCGYLGVNEDGVHVYTFDKDWFCSYPWDNFSYVSTSSQDGSTVIQFDQYAREVTFTANVHDPFMAASILRLCDHFSRRNRGSR